MAIIECPCCDEEILKCEFCFEHVSHRDTATAADDMNWGEEPGERVGLDCGVRELATRVSDWEARGRSSARHPSPTDADNLDRSLALMHALRMDELDANVCMANWSTRRLCVGCPPRHGAAEPLPGLPLCATCVTDLLILVAERGELPGLITEVRS